MANRRGLNRNHDDRLQIGAIFYATTEGPSTSFKICSTRIADRPTMIQQLPVLSSPLAATHEADRFERLQIDDSRSAIGPEAADLLAALLRGSIDGEVRFDKGTRALYATDGSNYRQAPIGVVIPRHVQDVETAVRLAREHRAPILARARARAWPGNAAMSHLCSISRNTCTMLSTSMRQSSLGRVQPGCVLDHFRDTAKKQAGLTFGPDPATHSRCTIGGMLGNNSCGSHSLLSKKHGYGVRMSDNTHSMDILLYDGTRMHVGPTSPEELAAHIAAGGRRGEIYAALRRLVERYGDVIREKFPKLERRVSGYNLDDLLPENGFNVARALVGSESTLVTVLEATLHLVPAPKERSVAMLGFKDLYTAAECGEEVLKFNPTACEGIDKLLFHYVKQKGDENASLAILPEGPAFLLVEFGGESKEDSDDQARRMMDRVQQLGDRAPVDMKLYDDKKQEEMIWKVREGGLGSTAWIPGQPDTWPGLEDSAVPVDVVPQYLRELRALFHKYDYNPALYGHIGQGCIHCRVGFDLYTAAGHREIQAIHERGRRAGGQLRRRRLRRAWRRPGTRAVLPRMFGNEIMQAFTEFKRIWDPANRMSTGKLVNLEGATYGITENMRVGPDYHPPQVENAFQLHRRSAQLRASRTALRRAWALAAAKGAGQCAPRTWSRAKKKIPRAAGPGCSSK